MRDSAFLFLKLIIYLLELKKEPPPRGGPFFTSGKMKFTAVSLTLNESYYLKKHSYDPVTDICSTNES